MKQHIFGFAILISTSLHAEGISACKIAPENDEIRAAYLKLSQTEMKSLRSKYESMGPNDEPPFPVEGLSKIDAELMRVALIAREESVINILVTVNSQGNPESVSFPNHSNWQVPKYMAGYLMDQKYKPALCNCIPCKQEFMYYRELDIRPIR